jgi:hypothetical protein
MTNTDQKNLADALNFLASSTDELKKHWSEYLSNAYDDAEDLSDRFFFEDMKEIAAYIMEKWKRRETSEFATIFSTLEDIFINRDSITQSSISAGLIEDIHSYIGIDFHTAFNEWVQPNTRIRWDNALDYWRFSDKP